MTVWTPYMISRMMDLRDKHLADQIARAEALGIAREDALRVYRDADKEACMSEAQYDVIEPVRVLGRFLDRRERLGLAHQAGEDAYARQSEG